MCAKSGGVDETVIVPPNSIVSSTAPVVGPTAVGAPAFVDNAVDAPPLNENVGVANVKLPSTKSVIVPYAFSDAAAGV